MLVTSIFFFSHNLFENIPTQGSLKSCGRLLKDSADDSQIEYISDMKYLHHILCMILELCARGDLAVPCKIRDNLLTPSPSLRPKNPFVIVKKESQLNLC